MEQDPNNEAKNAGIQRIESKATLELKAPRRMLASVRHPVAGDDEIESYAHGVISGTMKMATPNAVGSLLARIRQLLAVEDNRNQLRKQIQDLNRGMRNRTNCETCGEPLSSTCAKCQRLWES